MHVKGEKGVACMPSHSHLKCKNILNRGCGVTAILRSTEFMTTSNLFYIKYLLILSKYSISVEIQKETSDMQQSFNYKQVAEVSLSSLKPL